MTMPYREAGLNDRRAAEVLLDRFTYGARPGEAERVMELGLARWMEQQLSANANEAELDKRLASYPALRMTDQELFGRFPSSAQSTAHARRFFDLVPPADAMVDSTWNSRKLAQFRKEQGYQSQDVDLYRDLTAQKLLRAVYAQNQLTEVLTGFWHNHFYTSSSNFRSRPWVLSHESTAIRPQALGRFRALLGASARHPAQVQATLSDARKATVSEADTTFGHAVARLMRHEGGQSKVDAFRQQLRKIEAEEDLLLQRRFWPESGPNLEYARLLLQQTLGRGAYSDKDLEETARVFTGWSTLPYGVDERWFSGGFSLASAAGFMQQGSFVFRADRHDARAKQVLGRRFAAGGGMEEGEQLLDMLARHPRTAQNIATALAEQFVGAEPGSALIDSLAATFRSGEGDVREMLRTLVQSREFWRKAAARNKVKTPFEYAVSALRAAQADVADAWALVRWVAEMGQPLYAYMDSGGIPRDQQWMSGPALTTRIKFALSLGAGQIEGVAVPMAAERLAVQIAAPRFQLR
jgi:uncharacterized protein (DUF1800 family)